MIDKDKFVEVTKRVIKELEGGYFHPYMFRDGRLTWNDLYKWSGETMFGLDRHAGHGLYYSSPRITSDVTANIPHIESGRYQYRTPEAREFWNVIDAAGARKNWRWNYKGGQLEERLTNLAAKIIYDPFIRYSEKYLSPEARKIVASDPRLVFHFAYAVWNGEGRFQQYAQQLNAWIASGVKNPTELLRRSIALRSGSTNAIIAQQGRKISSFIDTVTFGKSESKLFFLDHIRSVRGDLIRIIEQGQKAIDLIDEQLKIYENGSN